MTDDAYELSYDAPKRLLMVRMSGFWDEPTISAFASDVRTLFAGLRHLPHHGGRVLVDVTSFAVQYPSTIERIAVTTALVSRNVDRFALLNSGSALQRRQIERVLPTESLRVFDDRVMALNWLNGEAVL